MSLWRGHAHDHRSRMHGVQLLPDVAPPQVVPDRRAHALRLVMERGGQKVKAEGKEATMELMDKMMDQVN